MSVRPTGSVPPPDAIHPHRLPSAHAASVEARERPLAVAAPERAGSTAGTLALLSLALVLWFGFQALQAWNEREALQAARASQEDTVPAAIRLRGQLDAVARETRKLADAGNANARLLVDELQRRGVTIDPNAPAAPSP